MSADGIYWQLIDDKGKEFTTSKLLGRLFAPCKPCKRLADAPNDQNQIFSFSVCSGAKYGIQLATESQQFCLLDDCRSLVRLRSIVEGVRWELIERISCDSESHFAFWYEPVLSQYWASIERGNVRPYAKVPKLKQNGWQSFRAAIRPNRFTLYPLTLTLFAASQALIRRFPFGAEEVSVNCFH